MVYQIYAPKSGSLNNLFQIRMGYKVFIEKALEGSRHVSAIIILNELISFHHYTDVSQLVVTNEDKC